MTHSKSVSEYLHVLDTMKPYGQSDIICRYVEEANDYESRTPLEEVSRYDVNRESLGLHHIDSKIIELLQGILNDGAISLDVAFCRLIIILPYVQHNVVFGGEFLAFFF
eukprot:163354_1